MKIRFVVLVFIIIGISACERKSSINERDLAVAIKGYLDQHGNVCLGLHNWSPDGELVQTDSLTTNQTDSLDQMKALASVGLVNIVLKSPEQAPSLGMRFILNDSGKPYFEKVVTSSLQGNSVQRINLGDFCYGKMVLDHVVGWKLINAQDQHQTVEVKYISKGIVVANWAKDKKISETFPQVKAFIAKKIGDPQEAILESTDSGWRLK